jgi:hypothetical protein
MTAVLEQPVAETVDPPKYKMPDVSIGHYVLYYRDGKRTGRKEVARVYGMSVAGLSVHLDIGGVKREGVRHVDDPRLAQHPEMRTNGAWEHTEDTKSLQLMAQDYPVLKERVAMLEQLIESKTSKKS